MRGMNIGLENNQRRSLCYLEFFFDAFRKRCKKAIVLEKEISL
jgi:hypothetical protein